jgi:hypothetical protein
MGDTERTGEQSPAEGNCEGSSMRYMITQSLLNSWIWTMKENPYEQMSDSDEEKLSKMDEFMLTLNREPIPTNEAMQNGIDFEELVIKIATDAPNYDHKWCAAASEVAAVVKGALFQFRASKEVEVQGMTLLLYGKFDALKAGVIYDIKFSKSYESGKFIESIQHPMYMELCPEAEYFSYLISNGSNVYQETYRRDETESIIPTIEQFLTWLDGNGLTDIYKEKWLAQ